MRDDTLETFTLPQGEDWEPYRHDMIAMMQDGDAAERQLEQAQGAMDNYVLATRIQALEAVQLLFAVGPDHVALPLAPSGWLQATRQPFVQDANNWMHTVVAQLPLEGLRDMLDEVNRLVTGWNSQLTADVLKKALLTKLFGSLHSPMGFVLVPKHTLEHLPLGFRHDQPACLAGVGGHLPFVRAFEAMPGQEEHRWGVFFPENRPVMREGGLYAFKDWERHEHGWAFATRDDAMARAVELAEMAPTQRPDTPLPIPVGGLDLQGLPLGPLFAN